MTHNIEPKTDVSIRAARALSKLLFGGAQYRLEIGAAIAARPMANTAELAAALGITRQSVNKELQLLVQTGLLTRAPKDPDTDSGRKVFFLLEESGYWAWCQEAFSQAAVMLERERRF